MRLRAAYSTVCQVRSSSTGPTTTAPNTRPPRKAAISPLPPTHCAAAKHVTASDATISRDHSSVIQPCLAVAEAPKSKNLNN
jgi:hypothetical protein